MAPVTIDEYEARQVEIKARIAEIDNEFAGKLLSDEARAEWNTLNEERDENVKVLKELKARSRRVGELEADESRTEGGADFYVSTGVPTGADLYDLSSIRLNLVNPEQAGRELRDRAKRAIEGARFPHPNAKREEVQGHIERMLETIDTEEGTLARHILNTGSPTYKRAFGKYLAGKYLSQDENRALSLTTTAGGFAVPFVLDPTIIPTSNLAVNPYRAISRVEQIVVDEWRGVSSAGVTAAYGAEATASTDNAPTLAQPTVSTEKAQAFVPFSIEIGMDWSGLQTEMARLFQDAKDELEATKFTTGNGTNEPFGVVTGATTVFTAAATNSLAVADIYGLEAALGPRFRPMASIVMNRATAQKIRQFDTAGGASLWIDNLRVGLDNQVPTPGNYGARLLGYPAYEASAMSSTFTTGQLLAVIGDFKYYVIVDRIGMQVETIPHLFDVTNNLPTGSRGLFAYWRNGAKVVSANAFRTLKLA